MKMSTMSALGHVTNRSVKFTLTEGRIRCSLRRFCYLLPSDIITSLRLDVITLQPPGYLNIDLIRQSCPNFYSLHSDLVKLSERILDFKNVSKPRS